MVSDSPRSEQANADVLLWQAGYRMALALVVGAVAVGLRTAGVLSLSPVAAQTVGSDAADWMLGLVSVAYVLLVMARCAHRCGASVQPHAHAAGNIRAE